MRRVIDAAFAAPARPYVEQEMHASGADQSDERFAAWILGNVDRGRYLPEESRTILRSLGEDPRFRARAEASRAALSDNEWIRGHVSGALDPLNLALLLGGMGPAMMAGALAERTAVNVVGRYVANRGVRWLSGLAARIGAESGVLGATSTLQEALHRGNLQPLNLQNVWDHTKRNAGVMTFFRGLGTVTQRFGVVVGGLAQAGGFAFLQSRQNPDAEAGVGARMMTAALEMMTLRWVSGTTNAAMGGALQRIEREAQAGIQNREAIGWRDLSDGFRIFGRQLMLAPLNLILGIPSDGTEGLVLPRPAVSEELAVDYQAYQLMFMRQRSEPPLSLADVRMVSPQVREELSSRLRGWSPDANEMRESLRYLLTLSHESSEQVLRDARMLDGQPDEIRLPFIRSGSLTAEYQYRVFTKAVLERMSRSPEFLQAMSEESPSGANGLEMIRSSMGRGEASDRACLFLLGQIGRLIQGPEREVFRALHLIADGIDQIPTNRELRRYAASEIIKNPMTNAPVTQDELAVAVRLLGLYRGEDL